MIPDFHFDSSHMGLALHVSEALANILVAFVLVLLHRTYRREFLLHWALSWTALALFHLTSGLASELASLPSRDSARSAVMALVLTLGYAQVAALLSGTWLLVRGRRPSTAARAWLLAAPLILGCGSVVGTAWLDMPGRMIARSGVQGLVGGLGFLAASAGVLRVARKEPSLARGLVAGLFALVGAVELGRFLERLTRDAEGFLEPLSAFVLPHFLALFLQMLLLSGLLLWFFEDERKALARTARALEESEQHRRRAEHMEAVGRLAGGVAHDFNNLLTAVSGHAELLLERARQADAGPGEPQREDLEAIQRATGRAAELVRELLTFARRQPTHPRPFSLDRLLGDLHLILERLLGESVRLRIEPGAPGAFLFADPGQIELAIINLACNARDAISGEGELCLRTTVVDIGAADSLLASGSYVRLDVIDSGCGISPECVPKIFEPYYTTKLGKGSGLGLASVHGIVKQSRGEITVDSTPGKGTAFHIWLPVAGEPAEPVHELVPAPAPRGGDESILLVEDDADLRRLVQRMLARSGYRIETVANADEAAERLRSSPTAFRLLLSDVVMPGRSLGDFLPELRLAHPDLPVVLMSAYSQAAIGLRGIDLEGVHFVPKPFVGSRLLVTVREALDEARAAQGKSRK